MRLVGVASTETTLVIELSEAVHQFWMHVVGSSWSSTYLFLRLSVETSHLTHVEEIYTFLGRYASVHVGHFH